MTLLILTIAFLGLILVGIPVGFSMVLTATLYFSAFNQLIPSTVIAQQTISSMSQSFTLLAVPLFLLAGALLNSSGMTDRMIAFSLALVGHIRGGLAHTVVVANLMMAGMSGSATSDAAGIGSVLIPALKKEGYKPADAAAIVSASATLAPIIPPSIAMVIYSSLSGVSLGRMLLAGVIPGVVMAFLLMLDLYMKYSDDKIARTKFSLRKLLTTGRDAFLCLLMPIIILGGMVGGVYTPTEGAAAAVVYTLLVGIVVYRSLTLKLLTEALVNSARMTGAVLFVVAASSAMSWILSVEHAGVVLGGAFGALNLADSPILMLGIMALLILILGTVMEEITMLVLLTPILAPIAMSAGIDPVQFGIVFVLSTMMGLITPPVGITMFITCNIAGVSVNEFARSIVRPFTVLVAALVLCIVWKDMVLFLPKLVMGR